MENDAGSQVVLRDCVDTLLGGSAEFWPYLAHVLLAPLCPR